MTTFKKGDLAVYPNYGVGKIVSIEEKSLGTDTVKCYVVTMMHSGSKVFVPVESASRMGLRSIMERSSVDAVYSSLRERNPLLSKMNWNRRFRYFQEKMKTGKATDIALVISDLLSLKKRKGLSYGEEKLLHDAEEILTTELSIAEATDKEKIRAKIYRIVEDSLTKSSAHRSVP